MIAKSVTLILSTYNWPEALRLCLLSIKHQSILPTEVIIADDGSKDETKQLIKTFIQDFPVPIIHVWHPDEGFKLSQIRNKAIAKASSDYIIQIDGDVFLHKDFVKDHLRASKPNYLLQGSRVMLGQEYSTKILEEETPKFKLFESGNKRSENALRIPILSNYLLNRYKNRYPVYFARGANMSFWKKDILEVNGYDESYQGWGHEDSDLTLRLMNKGVKKSVIKFSAIIYHLYHPEVKDIELEKQNKRRMEETRDNGIVWTENGINKYLTD